MVLSADNGWTNEDESVSVNYIFEQNRVKVSPLYFDYVPDIAVKIKNNTDKFIYIDLSKTYISRNGEVDSYQNTVELSGKTSGEDISTSLTQSAIPLPPYSSKILKFPLFYNKRGSFDNIVITEKYFDRHVYAPSEEPYLNENSEYSSENSPIQIGIAFSYSAENTLGQQVLVYKNFYVSLIAPINNIKEKNLSRLFPDYKNLNWFILLSKNEFKTRKKTK